MAGFARLLRTIWADNDFRALNRDTQGCYFMLLSQPALSVAGCLQLSTRKLARLAADTTPEGIQDAIAQLIANRFVLVDEYTEELLIRTYIRHDGGWRTPNIHKAIVNAVQKIESSELRAVATAELERTTSSQGMNDAIPDTFNEPLPQGIPYLPASCSLYSADLHPAASSPNGSRNTAAAAAVDIYVEHRTRTARPANPPAFAKSVRTAETIDRATQLATIPDDADPIAVATAIFGITPDDARTAARALGIPDPPVRPKCETCEGSGWITDDPDQRTVTHCPDCTPAQTG